MKISTLIYIINASLLLLHEIESAYVREWEILRLPGKILGFLLLHIPIVFALFWGAVEIDKQTLSGAIIAMIAGVGGLLPFIVHKVVVKKKGYFNSMISNSIIYSSMFTGATTIAVAASLIFD